ncbi:MAG TPA: hypothetical protein VF532_24145 [Candidatus Angelobacter sp.]
MPRVALTLEEQFADRRSNEVAYKFKIENHGSKALNLLSITPRFAQGVEVIQVKSPTVAAAKARHERLCHELTVMLSNHLLLLSQGYRDRAKQAALDSWQETVKALKNPLALYFTIFTNSERKRIENRVRTLGALRFQINSLKDGEVAFQQFVEKLNDDAVFKQIFSAKLGQLAAAEEQQGATDQRTLVRIEQDSFFAETYVLRYKRRFLEPSKYSISIEASYSEDGNVAEIRGAASAVVLVPPNPALLTVVALLAALLGVALKVAAISSPSLWPAMRLAYTGPPALTAVILSVALFNVYEFTDWGKKITMAISWRSALLVGLLCGFLGDRALNALKGFISP